MEEERKYHYREQRKKDHDAARRREEQRGLQRLLAYLGSVEKENGNVEVDHNFGGYNAGVVRGALKIERDKFGRILQIYVGDTRIRLRNLNSIRAI